MQFFQKFRSTPLAVLMAYSLLTLVFTYPLAFRIGSALPGIAPDTFLYIWNMEWVRRAIFEFGTNPFFTREMYYPSGVSLYFHSLILGSDLLALPLQFALGSVSAYMLMTLAMFVLSGYGGYLLAYELVRERGAAFLAGFIFTFSPYHLAHLLYSHFDLMPLQWLALFALALKKLFDQPSFSRGLLALVFLVWTSITAWYYALYAAIFFAIYTLYRFARVTSWRTLMPALALGSAYLIVTSPLTVPMLNEHGDLTQNFRGADEAERFSGNLLSYITPSSYHTLWGSVFAPVASTFNGGAAERTLFLGYTTIGLALVALARQRGRELFLWFAIALVFLLLSLGPFLHIGASSRFGPGRTLIELPYSLAFNVPVLSALFTVARSISRFGVMVALSCALLAAFGLKELAARVPRISRGLMTALACALVGVEFLVVPLTTTSAQVPAAIQAIAAERGSFAMFDLPVDFYAGSEAMFYWTVDHRPTTIGYHSRLLPYPGIDGVPAMRALVGQSEAPDFIAEPNPSPLQVLNGLNVRYIALHKKSIGGTAVQDAASWLNEKIGALTPLSDDAQLTLYAVPAVPAPPFVLSIQGGWHAPGAGADGGVWRWMQNDGRISIFSREAKTADLDFIAYGLQQPRHVQIFVNGALVKQVSIPADDIRHVVVSALPLESGANELRFHSVEPPEQPAALGLNEDDRFISVAFSRLRIVAAR